MSGIDELFEHEAKHPSYGTVQFCRRSGGKMKLFGSSVRNHMSTIILTIREATRYHSLHEDRIHGGHDIIEVELSSAQFAELLTTLNVGTGVPCTIRMRQGEPKIPDPPDDEVEIDRVQTSFRESMAKLAKWLKDRRKDLEKILEKRSIGKADKERIDWMIGKVIQEVESNWPFVVDQFNEATERVVTAAKSEVDSFVTHMVQRTGLEQLKKMAIGGGEVIEHRALGPGEAKEQENGTQGKEADSE